MGFFIYTSSHRQDNTYYGFCYTSRGAMGGERREYPDSITTAGLLRKLSASCWQLVSSGCRRQPAYLPHVWGTYNYDVLYRASDHARPEDATSLIMCIRFPLLGIATICIYIYIYDFLICHRMVASSVNKVLFCSVLINPLSLRSRR